MQASLATSSSTCSKAARRPAARSTSALLASYRPISQATAFKGTHSSSATASAWHQPIRRAASHSTYNSRRQVRVQANWGAPVEFKAGKVVANTEAASGLNIVTVDVGSSLAAGYTKPGQYLQIKVGDSKPGFYAIASAPDPDNQGILEFLIKRSPGNTAELLCDAAPGTAVSVSPVQGRGFPVERIPAKEFSTVLMFASGSGISPIKALIESGMLEVKGRKNVSLYYGTKNSDATAYKDLIPHWQKLGVRVVQVLSEDKQGYVQDVFAKENVVFADPKTTGVVLCGHKEMCQAVTGLLTEQGVEADKIMLNF